MGTATSFQVEHDLGEKFDRAKENPAIIAKLSKRLKAFNKQAVEGGSLPLASPSTP
jgi:hypothetical protein